MATPKSEKVSKKASEEVTPEFGTKATEVATKASDKEAVDDDSKKDATSKSIAEKQDMGAPIKDKEEEQKEETKAPIDVKLNDEERFPTLGGSHGGHRSVRSVARSVDRVDRFGRFGNFADFSILWPCQGARDLSRVKVSAPYEAWRPKKSRKTETQIF